MGNIKDIIYGSVRISVGHIGIVLLSVLLGIFLKEEAHDKRSQVAWHEAVFTVFCLQEVVYGCYGNSAIFIKSVVDQLLDLSLNLRNRNIWRGFPVVLVSPGLTADVILELGLLVPRSELSLGFLLCTAFSSKRKRCRLPHSIVYGTIPVSFKSFAVAFGVNGKQDIVQLI